MGPNSTATLLLSSSSQESIDHLPSSDLSLRGLGADDAGDSSKSGSEENIVEPFLFSKLSSMLELTVLRSGTIASFGVECTGVEATDVSSSLSLSTMIPSGDRARLMPSILDQALMFNSPPKPDSLLWEKQPNVRLNML